MKVVVIGGGIGGSYVANNVVRQSTKVVESVTIVEPKEFFEATPGIIGAAHSPKYETEVCRVAIPGQYAWDKRIKHVATRVEKINENELVLSTGATLPFDVLCIAMGSKPAKNGIWRPQPGILTRQQRMEEIEAYRQRLASSKSIIVLGGGVVGVELISELAARYPQIQFHFAVAEKTLLARFPWIVQVVALRHIRKLSNVKVHLDLGRVQVPTDNKWRFGEEVVEPDQVFSCFSAGFNSEVLPSEWLDELKQVKVDAHQRVEGKSNIFAVGDITNICQDKSAKAALDQGTIAAPNIVAYCKKNSAAPLPYKFQGPRRGILIRLGPGQSMVYHSPILGEYGFDFSGSFISDIIRQVVMWRLLRRSTNAAGILTPLPVFPREEGEKTDQAVVGSATTTTGA